MLKIKTLLIFVILFIMLIPIYKASAENAISIKIDDKLSKMESRLQELMAEIEELQRQQFMRLQAMREQLGEIRRMRNPELYTPFDSDPFSDRVKFETCGEDRFSRTIPIPDEKIEKLIVNGNFEDAFNGWEVTHGVDFAKSVWKCQLVYDEDKRSNVVQFERSQSRNDGSSVGISQDVFIDVSKYKDIRLKLDVKPMYQSLSGSGGAGGEYPAMVQVAFIDQRDEPHVWTYGFYYEGMNFYDCAMQVGQDTWLNYTSPNLKEILPDCADEKRNYDKSAWPLMTHEYKSPVIPKYITRVLVFGSGWDFRGMADNIEFVLTK